ncbi:MAG: hypothetical protein WCB12_12995 [Bryobacteraceae bacterium]
MDRRSTYERCAAHSRTAGTLVGSEELAQRMDSTLKQAVANGLPDIQSWIERKVYEKQQSTGLTYSQALLAVAAEEPELFQTKARMELDQVNRQQSIYFDYVNGQLVNPAVLENGSLKPLNSPLDTTTIPPDASPDQEIALRVARQARQIAASDPGRRRMGLGDVLKIVDFVKKRRGGRG